MFRFGLCQEVVRRSMLTFQRKLRLKIEELRVWFRRARYSRSSRASASASGKAGRQEAEGRRQVAEGRSTNEECPQHKEKGRRNSESAAFTKTGSTAELRDS